jgi:hypothetical protein
MQSAKKAKVKKIAFIKHLGIHATGSESSSSSSSQPDPAILRRLYMLKELPINCLSEKDLHKAGLSAASFRNRKGCFAIIVSAFCDAFGMIRYIKIY